MMTSSDSSDRSQKSPVQRERTACLAFLNGDNYKPSIWFLALIFILVMVDAFLVYKMLQIEIKSMDVFLSPQVSSIEGTESDIAASISLEFGYRSSYHSYTHKIIVKNAECLLYGNTIDSNERTSIIATMSSLHPSIEFLFPVFSASFGVSFSESFTKSLDDKGRSFALRSIGKQPLNLHCNGDVIVYLFSVAPIPITDITIFKYKSQVKSLGNQLGKLNRRLELDNEQDSQSPVVNFWNTTISPVWHEINIFDRISFRCTSVLEYLQVMRMVSFPVRIHFPSLEIAFGSMEGSDDDLLSIKSTPFTLALPHQDNYYSDINFDVIISSFGTSSLFFPINNIVHTLRGKNPPSGHFLRIKKMQSLFLLARSIDLKLRHLSVQEIEIVIRTMFPLQVHRLGSWLMVHRPPSKSTRQIHCNHV